MAEEEQEEQAEGQEEQGEGLQVSTAEPEPQGGSKKVLIIIIAAVVLLIAVLTVLIMMIMSGGDQVQIRGSKEEAEFVRQYNQRMQLKLEPLDKPLYSNPFSYTVNMKNGRNYIHLKIRAMVKEPEVITFLEGRIPHIDDSIITLLKSKLPQDIKTRPGLELLKQEIFIEFNRLFPQEFIDQSVSKDRMPVKDILIVEYFIQ